MQMCPATNVFKLTLELLEIYQLFNIQRFSWTLYVEINLLEVDFWYLNRSPILNARS